MKTIRYELAGVMLWLFAFLNVERLRVPLETAAVVYGFLAVALLAVLLLPWLQRLALPALLAAAGALFLVVKAVAGPGIAAASLSVTVAELCCVLLTIAMVRRLAVALQDVEQTVESTMFAHLNGTTVPFELGQTDIYREIRRARRHSRPMSLLTVSIADGPVKATFHQIVERIQRDSAFRYATAQVARVIAEEMKDCDIVTQRDDHFVVGLPEATRGDAEKLSQRLGSLVREQLGLDVHIGLSTFPDEEVTFERLLAHAELDMRADAVESAGDPLPVQSEGAANGTPNGTSNGTTSAATNGKANGVSNGSTKEAGKRARAVRRAS